MKFNVKELCTLGGTRQTDFLQTYDRDLEPFPNKQKENPFKFPFYLIYNPTLHSAIFHRMYR